VTANLSPPTFSIMQAKTLVVTGYGGRWSEVMKKALVEPFEKKYGARVALFGRKINNAENQLAFIRFLRLIADGEFFGHPGSATLPAMVRLMGEVDVPNVALMMNKTDFDRDGQAWVAVEARMHKLLASWVRRLARDVEVPPPSSAIKVAEQVRRLLSQALRLSDRQDLFAGFAPARPSSKPRDAPELPFETPRTEMANQELVGPVPSPSTPDTPLEARKRGFGIIAIRQLDPRVRSMTVLEDGVRTVVINSRYPLFLERRGDVWYQLETAAREICKAADAANVAEYEKRVNDIVLTALQLRASRRRRPAGRQLRLVQG